MAVRPILMAVSLTLQNTINWALPFVQFRPLAIGTSNEPAITIGNTVMQTILGPPFAWPFNRRQLGLLLKQGQQDYIIFMWKPGIFINGGWTLIDSNANQQIVISSGTTGATIPAWNSTLGGITTDGTATWQNQGTVNAYGNAQVGQFSLGWLEGGTIVDSAGSPHELTLRTGLQVETTQGIPLFVSYWLAVAGSNAYGMRFFTIPDQVYTVYLSYQVDPTLFSSLNQLWTPIPDNYSYIYQFGFLALAMAYADDPRFMQFSQQFKGHLLGASEGLDEMQKNLFMERWDRTVANSQGTGLRTQQGVQGRAL